MAEDQKDIEALMLAGKPAAAAVRRGGIEAMRRHICAGEPMVSLRGGRMVLLSPDELAVMQAQYEAEDTV